MLAVRVAIRAARRHTHIHADTISRHRVIHAQTVIPDRAARLSTPSVPSESEAIRRWLNEERTCFTRLFQILPVFLQEDMEQRFWPAETGTIQFLNRLTKINQPVFSS